MTRAGPPAEPLPPPAAVYADHQDAAPPLAAPPAVAGIVAGPLRPAILRLALPAVGTTLFQVLFNVTDTFWVGRTLGLADRAHRRASLRDARGDLPAGARGPRRRLQR